MNETQYNVNLPTGRLSVAADGSASVTLRFSLRNRENILAAIDSLSRTDPKRFWLCADYKQEKEALTLVYANPGVQVTPLPQLARQWREEPAVALGSSLSLAQQLLHVASELEQFNPLRVPLSPAEVFVVRDELQKEKWLVLPLPIEGAFADFIHADAEYWAWLSADELLGVVRSDRAYMIGAILYYCLVGDLFPEAMNRAERVRRLLLYRGGNADLAREVLTSTLLEAEEVRATRLFEFIMDMLAPAIGRTVTPVQAAAELDRFAGDLGLHQLACQWEFAAVEQNSSLYLHRAHNIIEQLVSTVHDDQVPWETVERLRAKVGDYAGAAEAAARFESTAVRDNFIAHVRSLIAGGDDQREELVRVTALLNEEAYSGGGGKRPLTEEEYLYLVYVHGRWLAQPNEALQWIRRDFQISWNKVVHCVVAGRLFAEESDWTRVTTACRDGRKLIKRMGETAGPRGVYATVYLDLLDAIAHIAAVSERRVGQDYLSDAFSRLQQAWVTAQQAEISDLQETTVTWLSWLNELASRDQRLALLSLGIGAFMQSMNGQVRLSGEKAPPIPWFDESYLFT